MRRGPGFLAMDAAWARYGVNAGGRRGLVASGQGQGRRRADERRIVLSFVQVRGGGSTGFKVTGRPSL